MSQGDALNPRLTCLVKNQKVLESISWYLRDRNYSTIFNHKSNDTRDIANKVILDSRNTVLYFILIDSSLGLLFWLGLIVTTFLWI